MIDRLSDVRQISGRRSLRHEKQVEQKLKTQNTTIIPSFKRIVQLKRQNIRAGGVAIYQNVHDCINIVTTNMGLQINNATSFNTANQNDLGEMSQRSKEKKYYCQYLYISKPKYFMYFSIYS